MTKYSYNRVFSSWLFFLPPNLFPRHLTGTYAACFAAEKVLNISGPASALTSLTIHGTTNENGDVSKDWQAAVAECTGPDDGFVYGGDPGKVLSFVHHREGSDMAYLEGGDVEGEIGGDYPALADVIRWVWMMKRDWGVLAFKVGKLESRIDRGVETGWECIFAANFGGFSLCVYCCTASPLSL